MKDGSDSTVRILDEFAGAAVGGIMYSTLGKEIRKTKKSLENQGVSGPIHTLNHKFKIIGGAYSNAELYTAMQESKNDHAALSAVGDYFIKNKNLWGALQAYESAASALLVFARKEKRLLVSEANAISAQLEFVAHQFYAVASQKTPSKDSQNIFGRDAYKFAAQAFIDAYDFRKATRQHIDDTLTADMKKTADALVTLKTRHSLEYAVRIYERLHAPADIIKTASSIAWNHSLAEGLSAYTHLIPAIMHIARRPVYARNHDFALIDDHSPEITAKHQRSYTPSYASRAQY